MGIAMRNYTEQDAENDRRIVADGRMQEEAKHAARIRLWIYEAQKGEKDDA